MSGSLWNAANMTRWHVSLLGVLLLKPTTSKRTSVPRNCSSHQAAASFCSCSNEIVHSEFSPSVISSLHQVLSHLYLSSFSIDIDTSCIELYLILFHSTSCIVGRERIQAPHGHSERMRRELLCLDLEDLEDSQVNSHVQLP